MNIYEERLAKLKQRMKKKGVAAYYIPTADFHDSEYVSDYFKVREFFSGFTGSAGSLVVTEDESGLWTDGRYFIQAADQLEGSGIKLYRMGEEGVPSIEQYIASKVPSGGTVGFDGRTVTAGQGIKIKKTAGGCKLMYKQDLSEGIFERPAFPASDVENLSDELTGKSATEKIAEVRNEIRKNKADALFLSRLDDIMWLMNIRGNDIEFNPVALSYMYITEDKAYLFIGDGKASVSYPGAIVRPYSDIMNFLKGGNVRGKVMLDLAAVNYLDYKLIKKKAEIINTVNPTAIMKAVKNPTEISHMKQVFLEDSIALTRFIKWVTTVNEEQTEMSAADRLKEFRQEIPSFRDLSFSTIAAYGDNAAIIHYEPSHEHEKSIQHQGLFMVDSGGQYNGGTTDVTRTIVMGMLTDEEKETFTDVAVGMLRILNAKFLKGCRGVNLDILARQHMWEKGVDFKHGTGHGVGYILNVHEGPQGIRWKCLPSDVEFMPGMTVTDEPGIYREGKFGVRTENVLLVTEDKQTEDGIFYKFDNLTIVPIDAKGIDKRYMTSDEVKMYEDYQQRVYETLSPHLSEEEQIWLNEYIR